MLLCLFYLLLFNELVLNHPFDIHRVVFSDISDTLASGSHKSLECEIVASGQGIVLVSFNKATRMFTRSFIKRILIEDNI